MRDRDAIAGWLKVLCERTGRPVEARAFEQEAKQLRRQAEKPTRKAPRMTVPERSDADFDAGALVLRRRTTLTFPDGRLALEELPAMRTSVRPPNAAQVPEPPKVGRNAPCPCGSGKKFKRCCGAGPSGAHAPSS